MNEKKLNNQIRQLFRALCFGLIFGGHILLIYGQTNKSTMIFDGRAESETTSQLTSAEEQFIEKEVRKKEALIKEKSSLDCGEDTFGVLGAAGGAFTRTKTLQKAFLYELCRSGRSFGIGGIIIVENEKIVAHYTYGENGLNTDIASLSDINQNGLSEILLIGSGTGQGYTYGAVEIIEITPGGAFKSFGIADTYSDNFGADESNPLATAYKVSAQTGKSPVYYRETFQQKSSDEKWSLVKKAQKFSLRRDYVPKYHKIT